MDQRSPGLGILDRTRSTATVLEVLEELGQYSKDWDDELDTATVLEVSAYARNTLSKYLVNAGI